MREDTDEICEEENARAAHLNREVAEEERKLREVYERRKKELAEKNDEIIRVALDPNYGMIKLRNGSMKQLPGAEETRQTVIIGLRYYTNLLREKIRECEESHRTSKGDN